MADLDLTFFIGHHENQRSLPVTGETVADAHAANVGVVVFVIYETDIV